ncbi:MAG: hypothetical protein KW802_02475 [Candidatus Doudnabacteria bacterium]|nr:hypothetical protein [Candidatus Doudnabacteria bacterium]
MDATDLRNIFYIVATIALILFSASIIAFFYLMIRIKKMADMAAASLAHMTSEISEKTSQMAKTWERVSAVRLFLRILKLIF